MNLIEAQESSKFRAFTMDMFKSDALQRRQETKMRILDFCSKYDHETAWKQIRKLGNSSFHTQNSEYQEWKTSLLPGTLMYTGKLGSGKSVLLANIVDDLNLSTEKGQSTVAYFFCKYDVSESLQAQTIVGSLIRQLLSSISDLGALANRCEDTQNKGGDIEELLESLFQGFTSEQKVYLVIDGLDECNVAQKEILIHAIRKIQDTLKVRICASIREEADNSLQSITRQIRAVRVVSLPDDNPDIETFIETELEHRLIQGIMTVGDPTLILEIQDALLKGSQGMFLWVALQIETLCRLKTDHAMREALANLPRDLSETFSRILHNSGRSDPSLQVKVLQLVLTARRPLTTIELREALSVIPGDATWDPSKVLHDVYLALACCGCLLAVDEEEYTVRVIHHSVQQYILNGLDSTTHQKLTVKDAKRTMADITITYLNYGVFGTDLSRTKILPIMAESAPSKILQATMDSSSSARQLAIRFLQSRRQPTFDLSKIIAETLKSSHPEDETSFKFYKYANKYWLEHLSHVSGNNTAMFRLSWKLIHSRASTFEISKDDQRTMRADARNHENDKILSLLLQLGKIHADPESKKAVTMLMWAASEGSNETVEVLLRDGHTNVDEKDFNGSTALMWAVTFGQITNAEILIKTGKADSNAKDNSGNTALMWAVLGGRNDLVETPHTIDNAKVDTRDLIGFKTPKRMSPNERRDMVNLLITTGKADVNASNYRASTVLMKAASKGYKDLVETLLQFGADPNMTGPSRRTALMYAAEFGMRDSVEVLLDVGKAHVDERDYNGCTALMLAAKSVNIEIVEILVRIGKASVDIQDRNGDTALMFATKAKSVEMVSFLLNIGKANVNAKSYGGRTALMCALEQENMEVAKFLLSIGNADVNKRDNERRTALTEAVIKEHEEIVKLLLDTGKVDVQAEDQFERALEHAKSCGLTTIVNLLQAYSASAQ